MGTLLDLIAQSPMRGNDYRPYQPETITRALVALRAQIIRDGGPGLEHVEALLALRGNNLAPVPRKATVHFRRNRLRLAIYVALRDGPLTGREIVELVCAAHGLAYRVMYRSVYAQLGMMKKNGLVRHNGRVWGCGTVPTASRSAPARAG